jgi:excisionase family DNA binding protein
MTATEALREAIREIVREELADARSAPHRLLDIDEAASTLSIGRSSLYAELAAGRLRSVKVGKRRLVPADAIADYIRRSEAA